MKISLMLTTPPASEPVSIAELREYLRLAADSDDVLLSEMVKAARGICEGFTGRCFIAQGYSLFLDAFPQSGEISLPRRPFLALDFVKTHAPDGAATEDDPTRYEVDIAGGRLALKAGVLPPQTVKRQGGIEIGFIAGYGAAAEHVPAALRQAVLRVAADLYEKRGDMQSPPGSVILRSGAAGLLQPFRTIGLE